VRSGLARTVRRSSMFSRPRECGNALDALAVLRELIESQAFAPDHAAAMAFLRAHDDLNMRNQRIPHPPRPCERQDG
jgi:hypothetical protein